MKLLKTLLIFAAVILASACLAPWIFENTSFKFERILSRLVMVFALAAIFFVIQIRLRDLEPYGLQRDKNSFSYLVHGFLMGFLTLFFLTGLELVLGGRAWQPQAVAPWKFMLKSAEYFAASFLIGFLEEFFFRGFLYLRLRLRFSVPSSLLGANFIYVFLHFFKGGSYKVPDHPTFIDSFKVMLHLADPLFHWSTLWPSFLGLFLFGMILSTCFLRTGSLYLSIGLHAGCVFLLKIDNWFIVSLPTASPLLYGDKNLYSGFLGWCFLALLFSFLKLVYLKPELTGRQ